MKIFTVAYSPFSMDVKTAIFERLEPIMVSPDGDSAQFVLDEDIEEIVNRYGNEYDKQRLNELLKNHVDYIEI